MSIPKSREIHSNLCDPLKYGKLHRKAIVAEWEEYASQVSQLNFNERYFQGYIIKSPATEGPTRSLIIRVDISRAHELFPEIGGICQVQLFDGLSQHGKTSAPRLCEHVESLHSLRARWKKFAEFHVASTPSETYIDEEDLAQNSGHDVVSDYTKTIRNNIKSCTGSFRPAAHLLED